jgi:hypothetical protein
MTSRKEITKARNEMLQVESGFRFNTIPEFEETLNLFCQHLSKGLSKLCFTECDYLTIEKYLFKENFFRDVLNITDNSFSIEKYQKQYKEAMQNYRKFWEAMGVQGTFGLETTEESIKPDGTIVKRKKTPKRFNALAYIFNMKNRFPNEWNRDKVKIDVSGEVRTLNIDIQLSEKMKDDPNIRKLVRDLQFQIGNNIQSSNVSELPDSGRVEDTTAFETD